jgi:hypothetical protein
MASQRDYFFTAFRLFVYPTNLQDIKYLDLLHLFLAFILFATWHTHIATTVNTPTNMNMDMITNILTSMAASKCLEKRDYEQLLLFPFASF